ncbi:hypothetical protein ACERII_17830 [Evansella sp. AB-rgal1]|uniref:hypothetical protein n=1 Tax=Evansella sp. AB-rgal1 TaxID=3242696 RepID=UPI00359CD2B4
MKQEFNKPKGFGEILDLTFSLSKKNFVNFFKIFLILLGPIFILEAIIRWYAGASLVRDFSEGATWIDQIIASFDDTDITVDGNWGDDLWIGVVNFFGLFLYPIAYAAIVLAVNQIRKGEEFTVGPIIKKAFFRFWPIIGSSIVYFLIFLGLLIAFIVAIAIFGFMSIVANPFVGMLMIFLLGIGAFIGGGYLLTRWSFYLASVVLEDELVGISRSWNLTSNRGWILLGLYIVFTLIITIISTVVELTFVALLGYSVLLFTITNVVLLITTMIFSVGYSVMYFDLKTRHDADDIKDMLNDYENK